MISLPFLIGLVVLLLIFLSARQSRTCGILFTLGVDKLQESGPVEASCSTCVGRMGRELGLREGAATSPLAGKAHGGGCEPVKAGERRGRWGGEPVE